MLHCTCKAEQAEANGSLPALPINGEYPRWQQALPGVTASSSWGKLSSAICVHSQCVFFPILHVNAFLTTRTGKRRKHVYDLQTHSWRASKPTDRQTDYLSRFPARLLNANRFPASKSLCNSLLHTRVSVTVGVMELVKDIRTSPGPDDDDGWHHHLSLKSYSSALGFLLGFLCIMVSSF